MKPEWTPLVGEWLWPECNCHPPLAVLHCHHHHHYHHQHIHRSRRSGCLSGISDWSTSGSGRGPAWQWTFIALALQTLWSCVTLFSQVWHQEAQQLIFTSLVVQLISELCSWSQLRPRIIWLLPNPVTANCAHLVWSQYHSATSMTLWMPSCSLGVPSTLYTGIAHASDYITQTLGWWRDLSLLNWAGQRLHRPHQCQWFEFWHPSWMTSHWESLQGCNA